MKTKLPTAIIYGWDRLGVHEIVSDIYNEEYLFEKVIVHSFDNIKNILLDCAKVNPDIILTIGNHPVLDDKVLGWKHICYDSILPDNIIGNDIVIQSTYSICRNVRPMFSIFTPTYKTGIKILKTYESIKNQIFTDWEWVIVDDSDDDYTWSILNEITNKDHRIKIHKIYPLTNGNVGLAKNRAASMCNGEWLVELDHDDELTNHCLLELSNASMTYPDAGFMYSDVCELYEDGEMKYYDGDLSGNYYAREGNIFDFGYAGHSWVHYNGKDYINHHYPDINPITIRFNISMPNHVRCWKKFVYDKIGGHNKRLPVADDFELITRTFLETRMIHVKKMLYLQWNDRNSTTDNNSIDINRRARIIKDYYDKQVHDRIISLGFHDWNWFEDKQHSQRFEKPTTILKYYEEEQVLNYIYE